MSLATPTTQELADSIIASLEVKLEQDFPILPKAFTRVLAKVLAGVFIILYKYCGFLFLQMFATLATYEETTVNGKTIRPLLELGRQVGEPDPRAATNAEIKVRVTVKQQTGSLPAQTQILHAASGVLYLTTSGVALNAATVDVTAIATSDQAGGGGAGSIGNRQVGDVLQIANPLPNVATDVTVIEQTAQGADAEDIETSYRPRVVQRWQARPQGGAYADYRTWGRSVEGIVAIYPYTGAPREMDVFVEASVDSSGSPDGIPTGAQLTAVAAAIELDDDGLASRRPASTFVNVFAITRQGFDVTVLGLTAEDVPAAQLAVSAGIDQHLRTREPFIVGLSVAPRIDRVTQADLSSIASDIASSFNGAVVSVTMSLGGIPTPAYELGRGEKAKLGTCNFI